MYYDQMKVPGQFLKRWSLDFLPKIIKFIFSKKATEIDEIFTVDLRLLHSVKSTVKISSIFVAFLENMNFM